MVTTAAAAAEPGKPPLRKPPALALPMAVNVTGSCPADKPRALAGCATLRAKLAAAKWGSCWSLLSSPVSLQENKVHHSRMWCSVSLGFLSTERETKRVNRVLLSSCLVSLQE